MKCPYCGKVENKVIDSRLSKDKYEIRRRRQCLECTRRFTTYEKTEDIPIMILKKDGRREEFSRSKIRDGLQKACQKRTISINKIEEIIEELERDLRESEEKEISSNVIGSILMDKLHKLDGVAYVRFASVYREFKDVSEFADELKKLPEIKKT